MVDKNNVEFMKDYLKHVMVFERYMYIWGNSYQTANKRVGLLKRKKTSLEYDIQSREETLEVIDDKMEKEIKRKKREIDRCKKELKQNKRPWRITLLILVVIAVTLVVTLQLKIGGGIVAAGAILMVFFGVYCAFGNGDYNRSLEEKISKYTEELKSSTDRSQAKRQKVLLKEECNDLKNTHQTTVLLLSNATNNSGKIYGNLEKAAKTLEEIYSMDVLPEKYRSLNAATTLYEYLNTGRCTCVQGHGGIYDTYEYDLKLGLIIGKLDVIIERLDEIANNQMMLYQELKTANQTLSNIDNELRSFKTSFDSYATASLEMQRQEAAIVQWAAWNQWANGKM